MKKLTLLFLGVIFASSITYFGCNKKNDFKSPSEATLISKAKDFFDAKVLPEADKYIKTQNVFIPTLFKKPVWESAYTLKLQSGDIVVVPIKYESKLYVTTSFSEKNKISLDDITKLIIYKTLDQKYHAEVITGFRIVQINIIMNFQGFYKLKIG